MVSELELKLFLEYVHRRLSFELNDEAMGRLAVNIVKTLLERGEAVPDEVLSLAVNSNVTVVRRVLHVMHRAGLVALTRETPDQYRYDYKWYINDEFIRKFLMAHVEKVVSKMVRLMNSLTTGTLYVCTTCYRGYTLDEAYEYDFTCPRDDTVLTQLDSQEGAAALGSVLKVLRQSQGPGTSGTST